MDCCANCSSIAGEGVSLNTCKSCMLVSYCNAKCKKKHRPKHKKQCKRHAAKIRDEALFKDPPAKEDCPICFLPMPAKLIACMTLPPATVSSVPIYNFAEANEELADISTVTFSSCCGKNICGGCIHSFCRSRNNRTCVFCKTKRIKTTDEESVEELLKWVEVNDAGAIYVLGSYYFQGKGGLKHDQEKAKELWTRAAALGSSVAHFAMGLYSCEGWDSKESKFHYEAAAMTGHENARCNLGTMEAQSGNMGQAVKHWTIAASAGDCNAMQCLLIAFSQGLTSRATIDATLTAYNTSCAEMRSEERDSAIRLEIASIGA